MTYHSRFRLGSGSLLSDLTGQVRVLFSRFWRDYELAEVCPDGRQVFDESTRKSAPCGVCPAASRGPAWYVCAELCVDWQNTSPFTSRGRGSRCYEVVDRGIEQLDLSHLTHRTLDSLSGGESEITLLGPLPNKTPLYFSTNLQLH